MAALDKKRILSVRLRRPTGDQELEVRFETKEYDEVDAVFTSVDAVKKILVPFYEGIKRGDGEQLLKEAQDQAQDDVCMVLHKKPCSRIVPRIDWKATSPIRL